MSKLSYDESVINSFLSGKSRGDAENSWVVLTDIASVRDQLNSNDGYWRGLREKADSDLYWWVKNQINPNGGQVNGLFLTLSDGYAKLVGSAIDSKGLNMKWAEIGAVKIGGDLAYLHFYIAVRSGWDPKFQAERLWDEIYLAYSAHFFPCGWSGKYPEGGLIVYDCQ